MKKALSFIVAVCLLLSVFAGAAPAVAVEEAPAAQSPEAQSNTPAAAEEEEVTVIREEESLRGEYEKHFLMSDGTYQAVVYSYPVHELVDGVWAEVEATNPNARGDVTTDTTKSNIIDNYVLQGYGVQNKSLDRLYIGNRSAGLTRAYIQFAAMPTIPAGATITAATMTLHFTSGTSTAANASAYQVTGGEWASGTIQWSNKPAANTLLQSNISHNNVTGYTFSCLTAVQHWYDGDTTGQNENYGIMLRYYDETTDDYNAVYSADYTDATKRPSLTINYDPPSTTYIVDMGGTKTLTVSGVSDTITWTSEHPAVATVDANGVVTGVSLGTATINASVGDTVYKTFTIRVIIKEGVYYIKNVGTGLYLGTEGGTADNTPVRMFAKENSGSLQFQQLWRIDYLENGYYSICPLYKLDMALHANGNAGSSVDVVNIGDATFSANVPSLCRWGITLSSDGSACYLNHISVGSLQLRTLDGAVYVGMSVTTGGDSISASRSQWSLEIVTGIFMYDSDYSPVDTSKTIELEMGGVYSNTTMGIRYIFSNVSQPEWNSDHSSIISVNTSNGVVSTHKRGEATITVTAQTSQGSCSVQFEVESIETIYVKNYYDGTVAGNTTLLGYIEPAVEFLNTVYREEFHIKYVMDGSPQPYPYTAATDACPQGSTQECGNSCNTDCDLHHKNVHRIAREAYNLHTDNHLIVLWSNSELKSFCVEGDSGHSIVEGYAVVVRESINGVLRRYPVVQMLTMDKYDDSTLGDYYINQEFLSVVLAHEVAHTLNLQDMYNVEGHEDNSSEWCVMQTIDFFVIGEQYENLKNAEDVFCTECLATLRNQIPDDAYEHFDIS